MISLVDVYRDWRGIPNIINESPNTLHPYILYTQDHQVLWIRHGFTDDWTQPRNDHTVSKKKGIKKESYNTNWMQMEEEATAFCGG